jgi:hypothetical protein
MAISIFFKKLGEIRSHDPLSPQTDRHYDTDHAARQFRQLFSSDCSMNMAVDVFRIRQHDMNL